MKTLARGCAALGVAAMLAFPSAALAQAPAASLDELSRWVRIGDRVTVIDAGGRKVAGSIAGLKGGSLSLNVGDLIRNFPEPDIAAITRREPDTLRNGALIGMGVGVGFFLVAMAASGGCEGEPECGALVVASTVVWAGLGAGVGVGIDALVPGRKTVIFQRPVGRMSVGVSPRLTPGRQGVVFSVGF